MTCYCGDTHCWSCGPAQGNTRCPICRAWADDGCEHTDPETGVLRPEFETQLAAIIAAERAAEDAEAAALAAEKQVDSAIQQIFDWIKAGEKRRRR